MATRTSLTSRGYTTVQAGASSTNRFLNPPRVVGEYTTVAEELRATKNAVGPAAQPLRPRVRVEQQISEGDGDPDVSYNATGRATVSTPGNEASLETDRGTRGAIDSFGGITKTAETITNQSRAIQAGLGFFSLAAPPLSPLTKALSVVAAINTSNKISSLTDPMYDTPNKQSLFDKTVEEIEGIPRALLSVPENIVTGAKKGLNTLKGLTTKEEPVNQQRKSRADRAKQSIIDKNTRDLAASLQSERETLQQAKEKQQQKTLKDKRIKDKEGGGGGGFRGFGGSGEFSGNESGTDGLST